MGMKNNFYLSLLNRLFIISKNASNKSHILYLLLLCHSNFSFKILKFHIVTLFVTINLEATCICTMRRHLHSILHILSYNGSLAISQTES